jgi:hypothetical protein
MFSVGYGKLGSIGMVLLFMVVEDGLTKGNMLPAVRPGDTVLLQGYDNYG